MFCCEQVSGLWLDSELYLLMFGIMDEIGGVTGNQLGQVVDLQAESHEDVYSLSGLIIGLKLDAA